MQKYFFIFIVIICGSASQAQEFTLKIAGGYAWPGFIKSEYIMGPQIDAYHPDRDALVNMANMVINDSSKTLQPIHGSYGQGMNFSFAFGYSFNPYISIELGASYLKSVTMSCSQTHELEQSLGPFGYVGIGNLYATISTQAYGVSLMPSITVSGAKPGWKVYPYVRLGITMPIAGGLTHNINMKVDDTLFTNPLYQPIVDTIAGAPYFLGHETKVTLKTQGTVSLGVNGAIGIAYRPLPFMNIFAEINGQYLVTRAKSSKITQWDVDGTSKLEARGIYRTQFTYTDQLDATSNNAEYNKNYDPKKPKDDIRPTGPFSNLGFNVGITFFLSKQTLKKKEKKTGQ